MYSLPAPPKYFSAIGASASSSASSFSSKRANGDGRSLQCCSSAPGRICSKPSAITQSAMPDSTSWRARNSADEPVGQWLLTLTTGLPVSTQRETAGSHQGIGSGTGWERGLAVGENL